jgi:hypothetical protein
MSRRTCQARGTRADLIEAQVLTVLETLAIPELWCQDIVQRAERVVAQRVPDHAVDRAAIAARMERLREVYADGHLDRAAYQAQYTQLEQQLAATPAAPARPDLEAAIALLPDLPAIYRAATIPERRALVRKVFAQLWMERHELRAITPTGLYLPLLAAAQNPEESEPGGGRTHDIHLKRVLLYH